MTGGLVARFASWFLGVFLPLAGFVLSASLTSLTLAQRNLTSRGGWVGAAYLVGLGLGARGVPGGGGPGVGQLLMGALAFDAGTAPVVEAMCLRLAAPPVGSTRQVPPDHDDAVALGLRELRGLASVGGGAGAADVG